MFWNVWKVLQLFVSGSVLLHFGVLFPPSQEFSTVVMCFLMLLTTRVKHGGPGFILNLVSWTWSPGQCVLLLDKLSSSAAQFPVLWRDCATSSCAIQPWTTAVTQGVIISFFLFLIPLILVKNNFSYKMLWMFKTKIWKGMKFIAYNHLGKTFNSLFRKLNIW